MVCKALAIANIKETLTRYTLLHIGKTQPMCMFDKFHLMFVTCSPNCYVSKLYDLHVLTYMLFLCMLYWWSSHKKRWRGLKRSWNFLRGPQIIQHQKHSFKVKKFASRYYIVSHCEVMHSISVVNYTNWSWMPCRWRMNWKICKSSAMLHMLVLMRLAGNWRLKKKLKN